MGCFICCPDAEIVWPYVPNVTNGEEEQNSELSYILNICCSDSCSTAIWIIQTKAVWHITKPAATNWSHNKSSWWHHVGLFQLTRTPLISSYTTKTLIGRWWVTFLGDVTTQYLVLTQVRLRWYQYPVIFMISIITLPIPRITRIAIWYNFPGYMITLPSIRTF